ncbi:MAG: type II toxin-antitoxin system HicB family antitoxin [Burkholderiaceae bacterium]|nr:type II toxin-antitoxin system HicB family antitoxin [Burkholderiaceae bacterium]
MNTMTYGGYSARVEFDAEDRIFVGHIAGIRDIVGFHGTSVDELETAFHEAVDDYLAACKKLKQTPDKPYSGRIMLRLPPELHARASAAAQVTGMSFNQWAARALEQAVRVE